MKEAEKRMRDGKKLRRGEGPERMQVQTASVMLVGYAVAPAEFSPCSRAAGSPPTVI